MTWLFPLSLPSFFPLSSLCLPWAQFLCRPPQRRGIDEQEVNMPRGDRMGPGVSGPLTGRRDDAPPAYSPKKRS